MESIGTETHGLRTVAGVTDGLHRTTTMTPQDTTDDGTDDETDGTGRTNRPKTRRRDFLAATGAGVGAFGLAGCVGNLGGPGGGGGGGGGGDGPIKVGHLAPVQLDMGKGSMRSARLAVEEINSNGGIMDRDVELVEGDTQASPSQASNLVNEMVNQDNVSMISGTFASEVTLGILDRVGNTGVPLLDTGSASPRITQEYPAQDYETFKNVFRVGPVNSNFQADLLADYGKFLSDTHGWNSFAVVVEDAEWTKPMTQRTGQRMEAEHGLEVTMTQRIAPDTSDFAPVLDSIANSGADAHIKAISHITGTAMLSSWGSNDYPFGEEGINVASMSPQYWGDTNGGCLYETTSETGAAGVAPITEKTVPFAKQYEEKHAESRPTAPMYMGFGTYDAMYVYKNAVEAAGTANYQENLDTIVAELEGTDYTGTSGLPGGTVARGRIGR
ncbi:ABC transporter substrate-binding protein [Halobacteriales archaeon QS_3_64_16]|nr:MAG: ABC transporter substrate-binding protein [Halobacteriales archaeon QS_3_64_16]